MYNIFVQSVYLNQKPTQNNMKNSQKLAFALFFLAIAFVFCAVSQNNPAAFLIGLLFLGATVGGLIFTTPQTK